MYGCLCHWLVVCKSFFDKRKGRIFGDLNGSVGDLLWKKDKNFVGGVSFKQKIRVVRDKSYRSYKVLYQPNILKKQVFQTGLTSTGLDRLQTGSYRFHIFYPKTGFKPDRF